MEPSERCHMARLSSLITAAVLGVKRCLCVQRCGGGELEIRHGTPWGKERNRNEVRMWVNPFFLTPGPLRAEQEAGRHHKLDFSFLYDCGHSAFSTRHADYTPCAFQIDFGGDTVWRPGQQACIWWKSDARL